MLRLTFPNCKALTLYILYVFHAILIVALLASIVSASVINRRSVQDLSESHLETRSFQCPSCTTAICTFADHTTTALRMERSQFLALQAKEGAIPSRNTSRLSHWAVTLAWASNALLAISSPLDLLKVASACILIRETATPTPNAPWTWMAEQQRLTYCLVKSISRGARRKATTLMLPVTISSIYRVSPCDKRSENVKIADRAAVYDDLYDSSVCNTTAQVWSVAQEYLWAWNSVS